MLFLRLIMRDFHGRIEHQWGFYPQSIPVVGDYISVQMVNVTDGDCRFVRCMIRSRELTPSLYNDPIEDKPIDEWECEITTEEIIEEGWFAESEEWNAQELSLAEKLKEGNT